MNIPFRWDADQFDALVASCESDAATPYILRHIPGDGRILEAGCGLGRFVAFLGKRGYEDIVGIELSEDAVQSVNAIAPLLDVRRGDVSALPFDDGSFDGLISLGVVEHFREGPRAALHEMFRVMRPGARAVITVPFLNWIRRAKGASGAYRIGSLARRFSDGIKPGAGTGSKGREDVVRASISALGREDGQVTRAGDRFARWPATGPFFEYRFTSEQFTHELGRTGFRIIEVSPIDGVGGLFYEFGKVMVRTTETGRRAPNSLGRLTGKVLARTPGAHCHMVLYAVDRPS
ncbi:MAG: class I SAM-dependent methyltransferase [Actinomycetota bacterium]